MSIVPQSNIGEFLNALADISEGAKKGAIRIDLINNVNKVVSQYMRRANHNAKKIDHNHSSMSDFPEAVTASAQSVLAPGSFDDRYSLAYRDAFVEQGRNFWEILNLENGITFRKYAEGERVRVEGLSGTRQPVYVDKYGGAIGWTVEEVMYRSYNTMQEKADAFRIALNRNRTESHYGLLSSAVTTANTTAWQGGTGSTELAGDIATLNVAIAALLTRNKDTYASDVLATQVVAYAQPAIYSRLVQAVRSVSQPVVGSPNQIQFAVNPVQSFNVDGSGVLLVLPGGKNQKGETLAPTAFYGFDHLTQSYDMSVWTHYGAAVNADQVQLAEFS